MFFECVRCYPPCFQEIGHRERDKMINQFTQIRNWARDRNLIEGTTVHAQMLKLTEEVGELAGAVAKGRSEETKLELGDCIVVLTILAMQQGVWIEDCIEAAYNKIKDRRGKIVNGVFVKEEKKNTVGSGFGTFFGDI